MEVLNFTTLAYREAAFGLVLGEASQIAAELQLPEKLPITPAGIKKCYIGPFGNNFAPQRVGNISTEHYTYYVAAGSKFSYLEGRHQNIDCHNYLATNSLPESLIDNNSACQLAMHWLEAISVDAPALNRDCSRTLKINHDYVMAPPGKFVPLYDVVWTKPQSGRVASAFLFAPAKTILELPLEDPRYVRR